MCTFSFRIENSYSENITCQYDIGGSVYVFVCIYIHIRLRWIGHVARMEEGRSAFKILTGRPTGKRPLGRPRRRWVDKIRMNLKQMGINAGNWVDSAKDRDYWSLCECGIEPPGSISHGVSLGFK